MSLRNIAGQIFGRLTVQSERTFGKLVKWRCVCSCGKEKWVRSTHLVTGRSTSCGCFRTETTVARFTTHGATGTPEYKSWLGMIERCENTKHREFKYWGGRGIRVCARWRHSFGNFLQDMGERPPGTSIDRYPNNDGNYEPGNCRWATVEQQANNKRSNRIIVIGGEKHTSAARAARSNGVNARLLRERLDKGHAPENAIRTNGFVRSNARLFTYDGKTQNSDEWAKEYNISVHAFRSRIKQGRTIEQALTDPPRIHRNKRVYKT